MRQNEVRNAAFGHQVVLRASSAVNINRGVPPLDRLPAKAEGAQAAHR